MASENYHGPKSLMKGELYQAPSSESWRVALAPSSSGEMSAITYQSEIKGQSNGMQKGGIYKGSSAEKLSTVAVVLANKKKSNGRGENVVEERAAPGKEDAISECDTTPQDSIDSIDFLKDDKRDMTFSRRIALGLMNKKWYIPRANESSKENDEVMLRKASSSSSTKIDDFDTMMNNTRPSLEKSWAYFEHVALYRYLVPADEIGQKTNIFKRVWNVLRGKTKLERAEPGESDDPTRLYHPLLTPHSQLGDFGLGIGLYFSTLRAITVITFLAGLVSIYNIMYFASSEYQPEEYSRNISTFERGSAICTNTEWVPCTDCTCVDEGEPSDMRFGAFPADRCARDPDYPDLTFVLHNLCDGTPWQLAAVNYGALVFVLISVFGLGFYLKSQEVQFDLDEQTAQDYSIKIPNPPKDAKEPDEWFEYFKENLNAHATVITIAVDNDLLVKTLVERRELLRTINNMQESGASMKLLDLARVAAEIERSRNFIARLFAMIAPGIPELVARVVALNTRVQGLAQLDHRVTNIFVTFETEADQRKVLESLTVSAVSASKNDTKALSETKFLFRGKHVLKVKEAAEPNTVRWADLNAGSLQKIKERSFTFLCTLIAIVVVAVVVNLANDASPVGAAFTISAFNTAFPMMAKALTHFESHPSESSKQSSLYFKICFFRWVSTSVVISLITPFTHTLTNRTGLITQVYALFFADIVTTNVLQLLDPFGHINKHILAPRAPTQDAMNLLFQGTAYELAERYTDMTKILFLCLWYSSIFPGAFFLCSFSLGIKYYVDRFSLMRSWKRAPQLGNSISRSSRQVFFPLSIVFQALLSSYYWSGFPFDNICANDSINDVYVDNFNLTPVQEGSYVASTSVTCANHDVDYRYCNMNMMSLYSGFTFPFVPTVSSEEIQPTQWMTEEQILSTTYYGWTAVAIMGLVAIFFLNKAKKKVMDVFQSTYKSVGDDQGIPFSSVASRSAYLPQVNSRLFAYPLVACNTDDIDEELYDWEDPDRDFRFYDLTKDAKKLLGSGLKSDEPPGFSRVKHYPPANED